MENQLRLYVIIMPTVRNCPIVVYQKKVAYMATEKEIVTE